jgi:hypothetical protein
MRSDRSKPGNRVPTRSCKNRPRPRRSAGSLIDGDRKTLDRTNGYRTLRMRPRDAGRKQPSTDPPAAVAVRAVRGRDVDLLTRRRRQTKPGEPLALLEHRQGSRRCRIRGDRPPTGSAAATRCAGERSCAGNPRAGSSPARYPRREGLRRSRSLRPLPDAERPSYSLNDRSPEPSSRARNPPAPLLWQPPAVPSEERCNSNSTGEPRPFACGSLGSTNETDQQATSRPPPFELGAVSDRQSDSDALAAPAVIRPSFYTRTRQLRSSAYKLPGASCGVRGTFGAANSLLSPATGRR